MTSWPAVAFLAAAAGRGAIDASVSTIFAGAFGMTSMRTEHQDELVKKHAAVFGRLQTWALFAGVTFAGNAIARGAAFAVGKAIAALLMLVA